MMDGKTRQGIKQVLSMLVDLQEETGPIRLSIGCVNERNQVQHGTLVIHDAPGKVVKVLTNTGGIIAGLNANGLLLTIFPESLEAR